MAAGIYVATRETQTTPEQLAPRDTAALSSTNAYRSTFGGDPVYVLARGYLPTLLDGQNLVKLLGLEGCIAGGAPANAQLPGGPRGPCAKLARSKAVGAVYGPGTFVNEAVGQIATRLQKVQRKGAEEAEIAARKASAAAKAAGGDAVAQRAAADQARKAVAQKLIAKLRELALKYGLPESIPTLEDARFVAQLVFDPARGADVPKARFSYLFPSRHAGLIQARLRAGLSQSERDSTVELIRQAVAMPQWKLQAGSYSVTGTPVLAADLADEVSSSLRDLLLIAICVMALVLAVLFRARRRLLPIAAAVVGVALGFAAATLLGVPITLATVAALPVLVGLAVDYAVQIHARVREDGEVIAGTGRAGPTVGLAALATAAGFLAIQLSDVAVVREFGTVLVIGVPVAVAAATLIVPAGISAGSGVLGQAADLFLDGVDWIRDQLDRITHGRLLSGAFSWLAHAWQKAVDAVVTASEATLTFVWRQPGPVVFCALALAGAGWVAESATQVETDVTKLVPQNLPAVHDAKTLEQATGSSGEIALLVSAKDVASPQVLEWMSKYQQQVYELAGYDSKQGCENAKLCPGFSLIDLYVPGSGKSGARQFRKLVDQLPPYFKQAVVTEARDKAALVFGVRLGDLAAQAKLFEQMERDLKPPPGVTAQLAGVPLITAQASDRLSDPLARAAQLALSLLLVFLVLLAGWRRLGRSLLPLLPILLASGWTGLVLLVLGVRLTPLSATLGVLVVAIATEFSVLLAARFWQERARGKAPLAAIAATYQATGAAVLISGVTAIAGFAVLTLSTTPLLSNLGLVAVANLAVALMSVLVLLPAALAIGEYRRAR